MFEPGAQIGKYSLRRKLGQGGFGAVFAAYDESLDREVALKILNAQHQTDADVMRRFLQEARLAARIGHPGIVTMFECAEVTSTGTNADGIAYIAMELLDGESLAHRLHRAGRMPPQTAMEIARQLASALEAAHKHGIVHRDLKPDNIFLVRDPAVQGGERIKVLDFGIAKLHHVLSGVHTQTNEVFGTPRYMSPEQCRSSTSIDQRSDIYTLGCILFELLTGRPPFIGPTGELFAQHLMVEAPSVLSFVRETPYHIAELCSRMLAKDVLARPQSMGQVQHELEVGGAVIAGVPATLPPTNPPGISGMIPQADTDSTLKAAAGMSLMMQDTGSRTRMGFLVGVAGALLAMLVALLVVWWIRGDADDVKPNAPPVAAAAPKIETPTIEAPKVVETPKVVDSKVVDSKVDASKVDASKTDASKVDASKVDASKVGASKTDASKTDASKRDRHKKDDKPAEKVAAKSQSPASGADKPPSDKSKNDARIVNPFATDKQPAAATTGTLALRSTPSCEILVDGKAIAASTPQDLKLAPGKHRITLLHDALDIKDAFQVEVKAGETERVNRDLREKVKAKQRNQTINPFGGG